MQFAKLLNLRRRDRSRQFFWLGVAAGAGIATVILAPFAAGELKQAVDRGADKSRYVIRKGMAAVSPMWAEAGNWIEQGRKKVRRYGKIPVPFAA